MLLPTSEMFNAYATRLKKEISVLEKLSLQVPKKIKLIVGDDIPERVRTDLLENKKAPAIYFFTLKRKNSELIYRCFQEAKKTSSTIRKTAGLGTTGFTNICHVPENLSVSNCLYAGSVKKDLLNRLAQHLGTTNSGRTGAMYINKVLADIHPKPEICFYYIILDKHYSNITEHIESVFQDHLKPILGKRAFRRFLD